MTRLVIVTTHPIQYQAPLFRALALRLDLHVVFMMQQTPEGQASAGFRTAFEWDVPLLGGFSHVFANNISSKPSTMAREGIVLQGHEQLLSDLKPDVLAIFGWFPKAYLQVVKWGARRGVPMVCRGESNLLQESSLPKQIAKRFFFRSFFANFSSFAIIGKLNRQFYKHYGVPDEKLIDAHYSVDTPFFEAEYARYRQEARSPMRRRVGFAGKLISKKRPLDLLHAVARSGLKDSVTVVLIGDGPLSGEASRLATELGLDCEFKGFLNQTEIVRQGYADLDVLVLPSGRSETWGLVVNEAMTGGIPVIVSDVVGCRPDLVEEDETGYVFKMGDIADLARCLRRIVDRLNAGHDFSRAVKQKMANYSLDRTVSGFCAAVKMAAE